MKYEKNKITLMQFIFLIFGVQIGIGVLTLLQDLASEAGTDGWISIIIAWFLSTMASLIVIQIMKKSPNGTILNLITHYFGKWVGRAATIIFALYFAILTHVFFIREALFIQAWILPKTGIAVLILLLSVPSYLIVRGNITILGRYAELVFFMTLWTHFIYLIPVDYSNWIYLLPVLKEGWTSVLKSVEAVIFPFIGFELVFFLYPFLQKKEKASIGIVLANTFTLLVFLMVSIASFMFFSPDEIFLFDEPGIEMLKVIEFEFLERLEIVYFSIFIFLISTTVLPFMFFTVFCTSQLVGEEDHSRHLIVFLLIEIAFVLIVPITFEMNHYIQEIIKQVGIILGFVFPLCLWGYLGLRGFSKRRMIK